MSEFVKWYNDEHLHSGIKYVTPSQRHSGMDDAILAKRKEVYQLAKKIIQIDGQARHGIGRLSVPCISIQKKQRGKKWRSFFTLTRQLP